METIYTDSFYENNVEPATAGARRVLPLVFDLVHPTSVIDIGCGSGVWLSVARQLGAARVLGLDGEHVAAANRLIALREFLEVDLELPLPATEPAAFDLAMSLEVGEHLPTSRSESFVADLTRLAPYVLFSAAIPGQGGRHHVNEQWPDFWVDLFERCGFGLVDCIRPALWNDQSVPFYYRQNALLFSAPDLLPDAARGPRMPLRAVHPELAQKIASPQVGNLRSLGRQQLRVVRALPSALRLELLRRLSPTALARLRRVKHRLRREP